MGYKLEAPDDSEDLAFESAMFESATPKDLESIIVKPNQINVK